ncbi:MAG: flavodoxin family protein [Granulosicoccus sp.]
MPRKQLLIVANQPSDNTRQLAARVLQGATHDDIESVDVVLRQPLETEPDDVLRCNAIIIGTTENFGYMSGLVKDFFERIYYPCLEKTQAMPYALYIRAGNDGEGTQRAVQRIISGLRWNEVQPCLILRGDYHSDFADQCEELGMTMAAGLDSGIY